MPKRRRRILRGLLLRWSRMGRAPGWLYRVVERWGGRLAEPDGVLATLVNGCQLTCDLSDHVERQVFFIGIYEPIEAYLLARLVEPGMTVIDGGANVGVHTIIMSVSAGSAGSVHSFEPVPATFRKLSSHIAQNRLTNVTVNRAALWHDASTVRLGLPAEKIGNAGAYGVGVIDVDNVVEAPAVRLDDYIAGNGIRRLNLIKLDLEGAELPALEGMSVVLERDRPILMVEVCEATCARLGYDPQEIWELLCQRFGYRGWGIGQSRDTSHHLNGLRGIVQQNILFFTGDLPAAVDVPWDLKSVLRWARDDVG